MANTQFRALLVLGAITVTPFAATTNAQRPEGPLSASLELKFENGQANYSGALEEGEDGEKYRSKNCFKIFTIKMEQGKTYQIDHLSQAFDAYLYLENAEGEVLAKDDDGGEGLNSRIVFRADRSGIYRVIATSMGNARPGPFSLSVCVFDRLSGGMPSWFKELDKNDDGQVSLFEWRMGEKAIDEFPLFDRNDDGLISAAEVLRHQKSLLDLKLENGQASYSGIIEPTADEPHRGKKCFKSLTVKLEQGKNYQIDLMSKVFQAFLYLEDSERTPLKEIGSSNTGGTARIFFRADHTGTYRLIATSQPGVKAGPFLLSIRAQSRSAGNLPKGLPSWFRDLDKNEDGQVSLHEWLKAGKTHEEFAEFDRDDDSLITVAEILRLRKKQLDLQLENGLATYSGALEEVSDEMYRGKKSYKSLTIKLEPGATYQIDHISKAYQAFLYLEDADGNLLMENGSRAVGENSRIVFRANEGGTFRIIATSLAGVKTGAFLLSVRVESPDRQQVAERPTVPLTKPAQGQNKEPNLPKKEPELFKKEPGAPNEGRAIVKEVSGLLKKDPGLPKEGQELLKKEPGLPRDGQELPKKESSRPKDVLAKLADPDPKVRAQAIISLAQADPTANGVVPALVNALSDPEPGIRIRAMAILGHFGPAAKDAVSALVESCKTDVGFGNKRAAIEALGKIGPEARSAQDALMEAVKLGHAEAIIALGQVKSQKAIGLLVEVLEKCEPNSLTGEGLQGIYAATARALGSIGVSDSRVLASLRRGLNLPGDFSGLYASDADTGLRMLKARK